MKNVFLLLLVFAMSLPLPLADATIGVVGGNAGISISGTSSLRLFTSCQMGPSHAYTSQCQTDPPTGHSERTNIPGKVALTMSGTVSGYGAAGGAFRLAVIDGEKVADWAGAVGEQSEVLSSVGVCGFKGTTPKAYKEDKSITFSVSGVSTKILGEDHEWSATAGIYTRGIEWIGTASSSVEVGVLAELDKDPSLTVSAKKSNGVTMRYQQARDRGWSGKDGNGEWEVVAFYKCHTCGGHSESSSAWLRLSGAHSHHFVCGGCGKHIKCKNNRGNHISVSCPLGPNNETCSYSSYYKCSPHIHDYSSSSSPTDNTPNCSGCTSDCSSPCSCTNSGTCGGTATTPPPPSYHACGVHETSISGDHSLQASCSSSNSNGSCTVTNFYACQSHTHSYPSPPKLKTCRACNAKYDPKSSSAAQHTRQSFPCGAHSGWACSNPHIVEHSTPKTCKRCGTTFYSCNRKGPCVTRRYGTHENHSAAR